MSANGKFVAFHSNASNLVPDDTNGKPDIFLRNQWTGVTRRVSLGRRATQADNGSQSPAISADGRYVAFQSWASNLVAGDTNGRNDIFVRDRVADVTRRVSVGPGGAQAVRKSFGSSISANGRYVAFVSLASNLVARDTNRTYDVFVRDRSDHVTRRVSVSSRGDQGDGASLGTAISADGRYVAFVSTASNLVKRDTNGTYDVFVRDRSEHLTRRVSVSSSGDQAYSDSPTPAISAHGRYVAFESTASNLVARDTNRTADVFVRDRLSRVTRRVSVSSSGEQGDSNTNGRLGLAISRHGRYVAFSSYARNMVAHDTNDIDDVFVRDRVAHATERVSVSSIGGQADNGSFDPAISADGRFVAFNSYASNLVMGDTNNTYDIFVHDLSGP